MYPVKIRKRLDATQPASFDGEANAAGRSAALECGTFVEFKLDIDEVTKSIRHTGYRSNGCGYMLAAADVLASFLRDKQLTEMHGFTERESVEIVFSEVGQMSPERRHCLTTCVDALRAAFKNFRERQIEEFAGEKPLVCTCFGITEDAIEAALKQNRRASTEDIGKMTRAGTGCGS